MNMTNVKVNTTGSITAHVENIGACAAIRRNGEMVLFQCGAMETRVSEEISHGNLEQLKTAGMNKQAAVLEALLKFAV